MGRKSLRSFALEELQRRLADQQIELVRTILSLVMAAQPDSKPQIEVHITSDFNGEVDAYILDDGNKPIRQLVKEAEKQFMILNQRSDVRGQRHVSVVYGGSRILLPEAYWKSR